jgi:hypothetical protein
MTRTWLKRLLLIAPVVASASIGHAQTPAPAAPAAKPAAAAPAAKPAPAPMMAPAAAPAAPATKPASAAPAPAPAKAMPATTSKPALMAPAPAGAPAAAAAAPAMPAPKPAPELDQLKFLLGKWRCDGKQFANPMFGPEHTFKATAESKAASDGFWNQFTYEEKKSKEHHGFKTTGLWGWDQGSKRLVRAAAANSGDWDLGSAPGLEGDKIVWTGDFSGPIGHLGYRHTFVKKSDKEWGFTLEVKDPTGKLTPTSEISCKR